MKAGKIHKLAASLYKPRGSKRGNKVAAYSPAITVCSMNVVKLGGKLYATPADAWH